MRTRIEPRYGLLTVAYLAAIYRLSSLPDVAASEGDALVQLAWNLSHVPLFAGLAICVLKSLSAAPEGGWARYALAFAASGTCAALDEWHQSFVPGRHASIGDFLLDLAGIGGTLILVRLWAARRERRRPAPAAGLDVPATSTPPPHASGLAAGPADRRRRPVAVSRASVTRTGRGR